MWHYVLCRIWGNLHRDIEIDRNRRSEELLKLGGGQKIFIFRGDLPYEEEVRKVKSTGISAVDFEQVFTSLSGHPSGALSVNLKF